MFVISCYSEAEHIFFIETSTLKNENMYLIIISIVRNIVFHSCTKAYELNRDEILSLITTRRSTQKSTGL